MKSMTIEEMLALSREQFIERHKVWIKEFNNNKLLNPEVWNKEKKIWETAPLKCPLHIWVIYNRVTCFREVVPNTMSCPICGHPCCPDCMNHNVEQLSRVTGYMSGVSGWNKAKQQEFKDRQRHNIG